MVDGSDFDRLIGLLGIEKTTLFIYVFVVDEEVNLEGVGCGIKRKRGGGSKNVTEGYKDDCATDLGSNDIKDREKLAANWFVNSGSHIPAIETKDVCNEGYKDDPFFGMPEIPRDLATPKSGDFPSQRWSIFQTIKVGHIFETKDDLKHTLGLHAIYCQREYVIKKSDTVRYVCTCVDARCKWRMYASVITNTSFFQIRTYTGKHTCSATQLNPNHRQAKVKVLAMLIAELLAKNPKDTYSVDKLMNIMNLMYKVHLNYAQTWRARKLAMKLIRGTHEESFRKLPGYCHNLKKENPGTVTYINTDDEDRFTFIFIALGASIRSFQKWCRKAIVVDAAHLKGEYKGMMLLAVAMDGNNQIVPIAFAICRSESNENWTAFFQKLHESIGDVGVISFITDRNLGLAAGIAKVYPNAYHGICGHHLFTNVVAACGKSEKVGQLFWKASKAYTIGTFNVFCEALEAHSKKAWNYVKRVDSKRWSRAHFCGSRYTLMTSNSAESVNALTREARGMPIMMLIEYYRRILQRWYYERRNLGVEFKTNLTKWADKKVGERKEKSIKWSVSAISNTLFQVDDNGLGGKVDLHTRTCSCRKWQLSGLPCGHVIAVLTSQNFDDCSVYAESWFTAETHRQTYLELIHPVPHHSQWEVPDDLIKVEVPIMEARLPGRPKNKDRIPSQGERKKVKKCTRCKKPGHNRTNCPALVPVNVDMPPCNLSRSERHAMSTMAGVSDSISQLFDAFPTYGLH